MDNRLKKSKDFDKVFKNGQKAFGKNLRIIYLKQAEIKVGYCVSKKHGNSVQRNRIKRLLREAFRENIPLLNGNYYFVVIPKIDGEVSFDAYKRDFKYLLTKKGLINA